MRGSADGKTSPSRRWRARKVSAVRFHHTASAAPAIGRRATTVRAAVQRAELRRTRACASRPASVVQAADHGDHVRAAVCRVRVRPPHPNGADPRGSRICDARSGTGVLRWRRPAVASSVVRAARARVISNARSLPGACAGASFHGARACVPSPHVASDNARASGRGAVAARPSVSTGWLAQAPWRSRSSREGSLRCAGMASTRPYAVVQHIALHWNP